MKEKLYLWTDKVNTAKPKLTHQITHGKKGILKDIIVACNSHKNVRKGEGQEVGGKGWRKEKEEKSKGEGEEKTTS